MDLQFHVARRVDVRGHFEHHADIFVGDAGVLRPNGGDLRVIRHGHLLADEQLAGLVVTNVDLRLGQHRGVRGATEELDEEIHANRTAQHARAQRGERLGHRAGSRRVDRGVLAHAALECRCGIAQQGIVIIIAAEGRAAIRRPAHAQRIQIIGRNLD